MNEYFQYSDKELFQRLANNDERAFIELYDRHRDKLFGFAYQLSGSEDEAKDLVQDVFYKIWERRMLLSDKDIFSGYLHKMIRNFSIDHIRRFSKAALLLNELGQLSENKELAADSVLLQREIEEKLKSSIEHLSPRQREIYILHNEKGLKYSEIADALGLSISTVENHFFRAVETLRKNFDYELYLYLFALLLPCLFF